MYVLFPVSVRAALDLRDRYSDKGGFEAVDHQAAPARPASCMSRRVTSTTSIPPWRTNTDTLTLRGTIPNPLRSGMQARAARRTAS